MGLALIWPCPLCITPVSAACATIAPLAELPLPAGKAPCPGIQSGGEKTLWGDEVKAEWRTGGGGALTATLCNVPQSWKPGCAMLLDNRTASYPYPNPFLPLS